MNERAKCHQLSVEISGVGGYEGYTKSISTSQTAMM